MLGHHRPVSETPFNGVSLAGRRWLAYSGIWILSSTKNKQNKVVKVGPPLTKLSGSAHEQHATITDKILTLTLLISDIFCFTNSVDPDQLASGSMPFLFLLPAYTEILCAG